MLTTTNLAVWKLNLPTTKKIFVGGILLLGGLYVSPPFSVPPGSPITHFTPLADKKNASVCVASAIRLVMMDQLVKSPDFTWAMSKVFIWSCCEPFVGIVCACLPTYAPLVRQLWRRAGISSYENYGSSEKAGAKARVSSKLLSSTRGAPRDKKDGYRDLESQTLSGTRPPAEDEIELTADIMSQKQFPPSSSSSVTGKTVTDGLDAPPQVAVNSLLTSAGAGTRGEIMVRKDFSWEISSGTTS